MTFLCIRHRGAEQAVFNFTISSTDSNWNVITEIGYTPGVPVVVNVTIGSGITVFDSLSGAPTRAMDFNGLPSGSTVNLTNTGHVLGQGGNAGAGFSTSVGGNGSAGGAAIRGPGSGRTFNVTNGSGVIWGGGGGGGGGGGATQLVEVSPGEFELQSAGGGGGGGGAGGSAGGGGGISSGTSAINGVAGTAGSGGAAGVNGQGGNGGSALSVAGGDGGDGGNWGAAGTAGGSGSGGTTNHLGGSAGLAGKAIDLNGGTVTFISGNNATRVKGAVS